MWILGHILAIGIGISLGLIGGGGSVGSCVSFMVTTKITKI